MSGVRHGSGRLFKWREGLTGGRQEPINRLVCRAKLKATLRGRQAASEAQWSQPPGTLHLPQACTATRPSGPAPRRAGLTRVLETSSFGVSPGGHRGPLTTKIVDLRQRCWLGVHSPFAPPVESSVCGSHAGLTPGHVRPAGPGDGLRGPVSPVR